MKIAKELTTITPLSKYLAALVFMLMPFIGFFAGIRYQQTVSFIEANKQQPITTLNVQDIIRKSFQSDESKSYVCPSSGQINCMPIVTPERQASCDKEYLSWAQTNCPGLQVTY